MYALSWQAKYNKIPKTTLIFIESDLRASKVFKESDLEKTKTLILEVSQGIRANNFKPKPDKRQCAFCPYRDSCKDSIA
jgi:CRISPR/Cas system-associated exonuclease Cas4 (RecB family)